MDTASIFSVGSSGVRVRLPLASTNASFVTARSSRATGSHSLAASSERAESISGSASSPERGSIGSAGLGRPPRSFRLRKRGRFTRALEAAVTCTTWWKDLSGAGGCSPARAWVDSYLSGTDAKVVNEKTLVIPARADGGDERSLQLVQMPFENGTAKRQLWVCPELVAKLVSVRLFRAPSAGLLASLRSRARLWSDEVGVDAMDLARFLPGSLVLAVLPSPDEVAALGALRGSAGRWGADVLGPLAQGRLVESPPRRLGDYFQGPLGWLLGRSDERVLAAGVPFAQLPA
uniref:Uncharacterized protein n=1 Tax=Alternaria dianthicola umbra-like virus 2 TaxID=2992035 RepID=A0A9E7V6R5_9TOMB|nr:hypothetical protein [Alternaria dianthicola umbra-like virus 2]